MGSEIVHFFLRLENREGLFTYGYFWLFKILTLSLLIDLMVAEKRVTRKFKFRFVKCKKYVVLCKRFTREVWFGRYHHEISPSDVKVRVIINLATRSILTCMNNVLCLFQIISAPFFCRTNLSPPQRLLLGIHNHNVASPWGRRSRAFFFASPRHKRGLCGGKSALTKIFCGIVLTEILQCYILEYTLPVSNVLLFFFLKLSTRILIDEHF